MLKIFLSFLMTILFSTSSFASAAFCSAAKVTVKEADKLRNSEQPYIIIEAKLEELLADDSCIRSSLNEEEISTLISNLLSSENADVSSEEIIKAYLDR